MCTIATKNKRIQLTMNVIRRRMRTFARESVPEQERIASEALCFFHTENFDNSQEKMEKRGRSSLGVDIIGPVPLTSY